MGATNVEPPALTWTLVPPGLPPFPSFFCEQPLTRNKDAANVATIKVRRILISPEGDACHTNGPGKKPFDVYYRPNRNLGRGQAGLVAPSTLGIFMRRHETKSEGAEIHTRPLTRLPENRW
jgi:hypothetical protein